MRSRPRPKIIIKKVPNNDEQRDLLPEKLTKFLNFVRFCTKNARLRNKTTRSRPGQGQNLEAKAEAKILALRPLWPRGLNMTVYIAYGQEHMLI